MSPETAAALRVVIDGQAYLYALFMQLVSEDKIDEDQFRVIEDEWKAESALLIEELLSGTEKVL